MMNEKEPPDYADQRQRLVFIDPNLPNALRRAANYIEAFSNQHPLAGNLDWSTIQISLSTSEDENAVVTLVV